MGAEATTGTSLAPPHQDCYYSLKTWLPTADEKGDFVQAVIHFFKVCSVQLSVKFVSPLTVHW